MDQTTAPCSICLRDTNHNVLYSIVRRENSVGTSIDQYRVLECAGCGDVCLENRWRLEEDKEFQVRYFPSPLARRLPDWLMLYTLGILGGHEDMLGELFEEIYAAVRGGQYRLAAMGIRSLLEQVMISKVGDRGDFRKNIDAFHQNGFISLVQRDAMSAILDAGHAVTHRLFKPTVRDLNTALDITEGIFAAIYVHTDAATALADKVPKRGKPSASAKGD